MSEQALPLPHAAALPILRRRPAAVLLSAFLVGNVAAIVFLWVHGGNWTTKSSGDILTSGARLTGLLSTFLALVQVVLLARLPALERLAGWIARLQGFDVPAILVDGRVLATPRFPG